MGHEVCHGMPEHLLPEEDHFFQALGFDRSYPAFRVGIEIWTLWRQADRFDARCFQDLTELCGEFSVPIHDQVRLPFQESVLAVGQVAGDLLYPGGIGRGGDTAMDTLDNCLLTLFVMNHDCCAVQQLPVRLIRKNARLHR